MRKILFTFIVLSILQSCNRKEKPLKYVEIKKEYGANKAQQIMAEKFYYSVIDEFAPFGNDMGNDTFYLYSDWIQENSDKNALLFLQENLKDLGNAYASFDLRTDAKNRNYLIQEVSRLPDQYVALNRIDSIIIALAFTQLFLEGKIDKGINILAQIAIDRELAFVEFWKEDGKERSDKLNIMLSDLKKTEGTSSRDNNSSTK
ncbi:hypothetical protein [Chryseobacterium indologenes]|uniref:Uncharacterized protein n=1 Tax=Chryseobacterium indologenes TaxID=253 RepID=A0A0N0ITW9_CHRID|nr:hypothetical protein [Chryseobacterium indologenes]KPE49094.1 hypothetical protein AOB46_21875 [Chryseobacterium indologenes]